MNLLLRQRSGKNRTLTNNEVKVILQEVNRALSPGDRAKLLQVLRTAMQAPPGSPSKCRSAAFEGQGNQRDVWPGECGRGHSHGIGGTRGTGDRK